MPGFPAFVLLTACIVFCVPGLGRRWRPRAAQATPLAWTRGLVLVAAVLAVYPFAVVAVSHAAPPRDAAKDNASNLLVPISDELHIRATRTGGRIHLTWSAPPTGATLVSYVVYRGNSDGCELRSAGAQDCDFSMPLAAVVVASRWSGRFIAGATYRVGVVADPLRRPRRGDLLLLSPPVSPRRGA